jgi:hypothetical protein
MTAEKSTTLHAHAGNYGELKSRLPPFGEESALRNRLAHDPVRVFHRMHRNDVARD